MDGAHGTSVYLHVVLGVMLHVFLDGAAQEVTTTEDPCIVNHEVDMHGNKIMQHCIILSLDIRTIL